MSDSAHGPIPVSGNGRERSAEVWLVRHGETEWSRDH